MAGIEWQALRSRRPSTWRRYTWFMSKRVDRVSETEGGKDFRCFLAHVRAGAEVVIERDATEVAVVKPPEPNVGRLSDSLQVTGNGRSTATLDRELRCTAGS